MASKYICGTFQPPPRTAVRAVRAALSKGFNVHVNVKPRERGPFSFHEVTKMWASAFPEQHVDGRLVVRESADPPPEGAEIKWVESEEASARAALAKQPPFWVKDLDYRVALTIDGFDKSWHATLTKTHAAKSGTTSAVKTK
jgi:nicotinamide mononucleotide adenylyltransferase